MVLTPSDRRGGSRIVVGIEKRAWNRLSRKFCLVDSFVYKPGHLKFSWDSKRKFRHDHVVQLLPQIKDRVLKRIGRIHFLTLPNNAFSPSHLLYCLVTVCLTMLQCWPSYVLWMLILDLHFIELTPNISRTKIYWKNQGDVARGE